MGLNKKQLIAYLAIKLGPPLFRLIGLTYRIRILDPDYSKEPKSPRIYIFWHGKMVIPLIVHYGQNVGVMISEHRDGEIIAKIVEAVGAHAVRGSSTRGALKAYIGMLRELKNGISAAVTPDGPQGPRHKLKSGALKLSADSGVDIYLMSWWAKKRWQLNSWDGFEFPKLFTRVTYAYKMIPALGKDEDLEITAMNLEKELENLEERCRDALG